MTRKYKYCSIWQTKKLAGQGDGPCEHIDGPPKPNEATCRCKTIQAVYMPPDAIVRHSPVKVTDLASWIYPQNPKREPSERINEHMPPYTGQHLGDGPRAGRRQEHKIDAKEVA